MGQPHSVFCRGMDRPPSGGGPEAGQPCSPAFVPSGVVFESAYRAREPQPVVRAAEAIASARASWSVRASPTVTLM